jgi:signal peptidase II
VSPRLQASARALALCGTVVALDEIAKAVARSALVRGERVDAFAGIQFANVRNRGIAFGLFGGGEWPVIAVTVAAMALVLVYFVRNATTPGLWVPVGLLAGGSLGNLADRVRIDAVTDFIDPPLWPAFNLADVAITAGVVLMVLIYLRDAEDGARDG